MSHQLENCCAFFHFSSQNYLFLQIVEVDTQSCVGACVCVFRCMCDSRRKHSALSSIWPVHFSHDVMGACRVLQMPDVLASPPLHSLPLALVPAWAQGLNQSIRARGTGAQQCLCAAQRSAALSGLVHLQPGGKLREEGEPQCPCMPVSLAVFLAHLYQLRLTSDMLVLHILSIFYTPCKECFYLKCKEIIYVFRNSKQKRDKIVLKILSKYIMHACFP